MKWDHTPEPELGDKRIYEKFLLLPLRIGDQTRWLEFTCIEQEYYQCRLAPYWRNVKWSNSSL